jgi:hypothetical protein
MKKIDLSKLKKLSDLDKLASPAPSAMHAAEGDDDQRVAIIVRVTEANYIPPEVTVRAQIDEYMFTANISPDELSALENDPKIQSFSLPRSNRLIE